MKHDLDFFDPSLSEYHPLSEEITNELKKLAHIEEEVKEVPALVASFLRKFVPSF